MFTLLAFAVAAASAPVAAAPLTAVPPAATSADDRIRCRALPVTGSLVRTVRACRTVAEWRRIAERGNENARATVESGQICTGGDTCRGN